MFGRRSGALGFFRDHQNTTRDQEALSISEDGRPLTEQDETRSYGTVEDTASEMGSVPPGPIGCATQLYVCVLALVLLTALVPIAGMVRELCQAASVRADASTPFATDASHPLQPGPLWGAVQKPYPTGAWWVNLALGDGDYPVAPLPYTFRISRNGVGVSYSATRRVVTITRVQDAYAADLSVSVAEGMTGHRVSKYDDLTVTVEHDATGGGRFRTLAARGSPYMTFEFTETTPRIACHGDIMEMDGEKAVVGASVFSDAVKLLLGNGQTWLVFTPDATPWVTTTKNQIEVGHRFSGIIRVALLPEPWDDANEKSLRHHAGAYPKGGTVVVDVDGDEMMVRYEWEKHGSGELLMMALPHHVDTISTGKVAVTMEDSYQTVKGPMTGIVGSTWFMRDNLTDVKWTARTPLRDNVKAGHDTLVTRSWEAQVLEALSEDVRVPPASPGVYGFGKEVARMARLALIADELGNASSLHTAVSVLNDSLVPWMKNDNKDFLLYDETWGGIVTKDGLDDQNADFGNAWYNDHTYHYGYLLYAAAVLCRLEPPFCVAYRRQLDALVADIAGTSASRSLFPIARQKDFYDWHSWTSGLFPQANGKSQESVSESVNAYYGVSLMGLALGDAALRDWGRVLLAMELRAARKYWQMPRDNGVYDSFFSSRRMVGIVASLEALQLTWFGDKLEFVHCINMLPFTPITEDLLRYDFVEQEWPVLQTVFDGRDPGPQWSGYVSLGAAVVVPHEAWENITAISVFDSGNSRTNSLYWIATRPRKALGSSKPKPRFEIKVEPQCEANSACNARGLSQKRVCCPTTKGEWLDCCPSYDVERQQDTSACSANPGCVTSGLTAGSCCPTLGGDMLACCARQETPVPPLTEPRALCSANKGCENLYGACCPTEEGQYLMCCGPTGPPSVKNPDGGGGSSSSASESTANGEKKACSEHPACVPLEGDCCPTSQGTYLTCCGGP